MIRADRWAGPTISVAEAARAVDVDEAVIRRLLEDGELEGPYAGKAKAVLVASVAAYQERNLIVPSRKRR